LPEPGEASGDPGANPSALKAAILERGITVKSVDNFDRALGIDAIEQGTIRLEPWSDLKRRIEKDILGR
jgi:hypothetical protein